MFLLVVEVRSNSFHIVYKYSRWVAQSITFSNWYQKSFQIFRQILSIKVQDYRDNSLTFQFLLKLLLSEQYSVLEEKNWKKDTVKFLSSSYGKIIFLLLTEVVILYMGFSLVDIGKPSFQEPFPWSLGNTIRTEVSTFRGIFKMR